MRILIVDNNLHIRGYDQGLMVRLHLGAEGFMSSYVRRPMDLDAKDESPDRVILTGSAAYVRQEEDWMVKERRYIDGWIKRGIPVLGICFGAQLLARHIFGKDAVSPIPIPISGSILLHHDRSGLYTGLPDPLGVVTTHYDGFTVPEKHVTGRTEEWPCYSFHYPPSVFGIQFHPELMGATGRSLVWLQKLIYDRHVYQDFSVRTRNLHGRRIYHNFIRYHVSRTGRGI
jgi:GMP synthase-like glutamine amidotransferase